MSIAGDRALIEAALRTVPSLTVYGDLSSSTHQGATSVTILRISRDQNQWPVARWRVLIVTGQDVRTGEAFIASVLGMLTSALSDVVSWAEITPGRLPETNVTVLQLDADREIDIER